MGGLLFKNFRERPPGAHALSLYTEDSPECFDPDLELIFFLKKSD
jgi:hypothetical protein